MVTLRSLALSVYLPTFILSLCSGLLLPVLPIYARSFGAFLQRGRSHSGGGGYRHAPGRPPRRGALATAEPQVAHGLRHRFGRKLGARAGRRGHGLAGARLPAGRGRRGCVMEPLEARLPRGGRRGRGARARDLAVRRGDALGRLCRTGAGRLYRHHLWPHRALCRVRLFEPARRGGGAALYRAPQACDSPGFIR